MPIIIDQDRLNSLIAETLISIKARKTGTKYDAFKKTYRDDPVAFVHDCIKWSNNQGPTEYQVELLSNLIEKRRISVRGPHGLGKSGCAAWIILWYSLTRDGEDWKIPTTASAWRQLTKFLWPEIHKWAHKLKWEIIGRGPFDSRTELMKENLRLSTGEAFAVASDNAALIEGAHADHLLYVYDESKRLDVATPIPTPAGWATMGDVRVGDVVLDEQGKPCCVTYISPILYDRPCSKITFEDGSEIIADDGHLWAALPEHRRQTWGMQHKNDLRYKKHYDRVSDWRDYWDKAEILTTSQLKPLPKGSAIPTCRPLELPEQVLSIDPYVLGAWLGDGFSAHGAICGIDEEIFERIRAAGYELRQHHTGRTAETYGIIGLKTQLRQLGLVLNKHIPPQYLRASHAQRLDLLRGLMDTDGHVMGNARDSRVSFCSTKKVLADNVAELVRTFGWKVRVWVGRSSLYGVDKGPVYILRWSADVCCFYLKRKVERWLPRTAQASSSTIRTIRTIERVPSVPTRCIVVDSPRHLYLAGEGFIPTHNTIPASTFDASEGAFASGDALAVAVSTPGEPSGRFYEIHSRKPGYEDWWVRHVTLDECIKAGRISEEWAEQRKKQWGESTAVYQNRVLGEFATAEEDGVIPLRWIEQANERYQLWHENNPRPLKFDTFGVDVARGGKDKTVIATRCGDVLTELRHFDYADTMMTVGRIANLLRVHGGVAIVDVLNMGAGVVDRLREQKHNVIAFNASAGTKQRDKSGELAFLNCLTEDAKVMPIGNLVRIYQSRYNGPLFRIKTSGGDEFTATANHNILTPCGWVTVQSLNIGDKLCDPAYRNGTPFCEPQKCTVPSSIGQIYTAAKDTFGAHRIAGGTVNFHGDIPMGEVDVVTINRNLLLHDPSIRNQLAKHNLIWLLHGERYLACGSSLAQSHDATRRSKGYDNSVLPLGGKVSGKHSTFHISQLATMQMVGLGIGTHTASTVSQNTEYKVLGYPQRTSQPLNGRSTIVLQNNGINIQIASPQKLYGFPFTSWLDFVFAQYSPDNRPIDPEILAKRVKRFPHIIPTNDVIGIEILPAGHTPSFVYTLETTTGSYYTTNTVHRNCRAAAWWQLRERLDPDADKPVALIPDDKLIGDLISPHFKLASQGKIQLESKDDIRKRLGRSTDDGDAVVMAFWEEHGGGMPFGWLQRCDCPECQVIVEKSQPTKCSKCGGFFCSAHLIMKNDLMFCYPDSQDVPCSTG